MLQQLTILDYLLLAVLLVIMEFILAMTAEQVGSLLMKVLSTQVLLVLSLMLKMASCTRALAAAGSIGAPSNKNHSENKNLKKTNKNSLRSYSSHFCSCWTAN